MGEEPDIQQIQQNYQDLKSLELPDPGTLGPVEGHRFEDGSTLEEQVYRTSYLAARNMVEKDYLAGALEKSQEENDFKDVALEQSEEEKEVLRYQATHDSLTGLLNGAAFWNDVDEETGHLRRPGDKDRVHQMVRLDLDHFKGLNDKYGHRRGDAILEGVGRILQNHIPNGFAGRLGGDEFAIFLKDTTVEEAKKILRNVQIRINTMNIAHVHEHVGVSIGVAPLAQAGDMYDADVSADSAAYASKNNGKNSIVVFDPEKHSIKPNPDKHRRVIDQ